MAQAQLFGVESDNIHRMRVALVALVALVGACHSSALPIGNPSDMPPVDAEMMAADTAAAPPPDTAEPPDDTDKACGGAGQPCCAEGMSWLPSSAHLLQGVGSCGGGLACAQSACPPRSTCLDGRFNAEWNTVYVTYCTAD